MLEYSKIEPPMGMRAAGDNVLHTSHRAEYITSRSTRYRRHFKDGQITDSNSAWFKEPYFLVL